MADTIKIDGYTYDNFTHYNIGNANSIEELDNANGTVIPDRFISIGRMINYIGTIIPDTIISIGIIRCCSLTIPASVESISVIESYGYDLGSERHKISIALKSKIPPMVGDIVNLSKFDILMVPQGALNAYKNHPQWGKFKNISENPRLNSSSNTSEATTNSNDEIMELRNEILELRQEIANIKNEMNNHKNTSSKSKSVSGFFSKLMSGMEQLGDDEDEYEGED